MIWTRVSNRGVGRLRRAAITLMPIVPPVYRVVACALAATIIALPVGTSHGLVIFRLVLATAILALATLGDRRVDCLPQHHQRT